MWYLTLLSTDWLSSNKRSPLWPVTNRILMRLKYHQISWYSFNRYVLQKQTSKNCGQSKYLPSSLMVRNCCHLHSSIPIFSIGFRVQYICLMSMEKRYVFFWGRNWVDKQLKITDPRHSKYLPPSRLMVATYIAAYLLRFQIMPQLCGWPPSYFPSATLCLQLVSFSQFH